MASTFLRIVSTVSSMSVRTAEDDDGGGGVRLYMLPLAGSEYLDGGDDAPAEGSLGGDAYDA
jgi:hypothetical protein